MPLGLLLGFLLLKLATEGFWHAALILPAYYFTDAGVTLILRILKGAKPWQSHSEHAYQIAVRAGISHRDVASRVHALNMLLIMFAVISTLGSTTAHSALAIAYGLSIALMLHFRSRKRKPRAEDSLPAAASHA